MKTFFSEVDASSQDFAQNRQGMLETIASFREAEARVRHNSNRRKESFHKKSKLLPRERLDLLLDRSTPFLELSTLAGHRMHDDDGDENSMGGGVITGIGCVCATWCLVEVTDSAIKGGAATPMGLKKALRAFDIARENKLPMVRLVESAGANLMYQSELFVPGGRLFCEMARLSAEGIPQITAVHGTSIAGGAYIPGLSDYVIAVRNQAKIALAGRPLLKAATGEDATDEQLGGTDMHAAVSGTVEYVADSDAEAVGMVRDVVRTLGWQSRGDALVPHEAPHYDSEDLLGLVPQDPKTPYDVHELMARLTDGSRLGDFKPDYGPHTVCVLAEVGGVPCGLVGNNGPIDVAGASKVAQFIQLCCQANRPLIYLQNTPGYMVGTAEERAGIVKHGSKMIQAVSNATVPQFTFVVGGAYGAGYYGMCGRPYDPRFIFSWPNARIGVMGAQQAGDVMATLTAEKCARMGMEVDEDSLAQMKQGVAEQLERESGALFATARLWDDGIIDPRDTRRVLLFALRLWKLAQGKEVRTTSFGVARM